MLCIILERFTSFLYFIIIFKVLFLACFCAESDSRSFSKLDAARASSPVKFVEVCANVILGVVTTEFQLTLL